MEWNMLRPTHLHVSLANELYNGNEAELIMTLMFQQEVNANLNYIDQGINSQILTL